MLPPQRFWIQSPKLKMLARCWLLRTVMLFEQKSFCGENMGGEDKNPFPLVFFTHGIAQIPLTSAQPACSELASS